MTYLQDYPQPLWRMTQVLVFSLSSCPAGRARSVRRHTRRLGHVSLGRRLQPWRPPRAPPAPPWTGQAPRRLCQLLPSKMQVSTQLGLPWVITPQTEAGDAVTAAWQHKACVSVQCWQLCVCATLITLSLATACRQMEAGFLKLHSPPRASPYNAS